MYQIDSNKLTEGIEYYFRLAVEDAGLKVFLIDSYNLDEVVEDTTHLVGVDRWGKFAPTYHDEAGCWLTGLGHDLSIANLSWDFDSSEDREMEWWEKNHTIPGGYHWVRHGDVAYGNASLVPIDLRPEDICRIRKLVREVICNSLVPAHNSEVKAARKQYGRAVNDELKSLGLSKTAINAYWGLKWRKETSPEGFAALVANDSIRWDLAMRANRYKGWRLLEAAGADKIQGSVPRIIDLVKAVCKARGEKPAPTAAVKAAIRNGAVPDEDSVYHF
jgi:hypothetical protein